MAYENYEKALISSFGDEVEEGIIHPENTDIQGNNTKKKYNRYISTITNLKPRSYLTKEFAKLGQKYVLETSLAIIIHIFGDKIIPIALEYFQHLAPSGAEEALDGISLTVKDKRDGSIIKLIEVPDVETSSNIVTIVHEFAHYYLNKIGVDYNKKRYYAEIMAILCEKIAAQTVQLHTIEKDYCDKITEQRLEGIAWHYGKNLPAVNSLLDEHSKIKARALRDKTAKFRLISLEEQLPFLKTAKGISALRGYYQNLADGYGLGFLYSESLLTKFLDDEHTFRTQLSKLTSAEQGLQDMLEYYDINASNNTVYDIAYKRIEEIKQFKRR